MLNKCHLCNHELFADPIIELKGMPKAAQYYPRETQFRKDTGISLSIYQCSYCGLVQHTRQPVQYYKEVITAASLSADSRNSRLSQMKQFVQRFNLEGATILDVGAGQGLMLDVLTEVGFNAFGIQSGKQSVMKGQSAGRQLIEGYIGDIDIQYNTVFDAFISLNYLEHLPNPGYIIKRIYDILRIDGVGYVTVPNLAYLLETHCFYEFVADHISYFTQQTLTTAFQTNGFDVLDCVLINNDNDIAITVRKKQRLDLTNQYSQVKILITQLQNIIAKYKSQNKKVAIFGAGHRTLALLSLAKAYDIEYIIDDADFKQGKFIPILHLKIVPSYYLIDHIVDLVIVMVPGIYPNKVIEKIEKMDLSIDIAKLEDNKIKFIRSTNDRHY